MKSIYEMTPSELMKKIKNVIKNKNISFIQIGVNDGVGYDIANEILEEDDSGLFIEPIHESFLKMCLNKKNFKNSIFLEKAVLPEQIKKIKMNVLNDDVNNLGASFGKFNKDRIIDTVEVDTITVSDLLSEFKINNLDFLFSDAESIDHLIILDFISKITPNVIFFETCWWCNNDYELELSDGSFVTIPARQKIKEKLSECGYEVIDYWENINNRREDMLAIKKNILDLL
jgi:FkbM family methyltransferase